MNTTVTNIFGATVVAAIILTAFVATLTAHAAPQEKVTICHATASEKNPFVLITVNANSIINDNGHGNSGVNEGDIIPPFDYASGNATLHFAGHNWDTQGQAQFRDCGEEEDTGGTGTTTPPGDDNDNDHGTTTPHENKVTICHATGSATNPFVTIHVSENAINGHFENNGTPKSGHEGDILLQGEVQCPPGNNGGGNGTTTPAGGTLTGNVTAPTSTLTGTVTAPSSTLTGTVTAPSGGSSITGTVTAPSGGSSITGTVTSPGGGSGGGGGGNSPAVIDYCPNIDGIQTSLPSGFGIQNGICVALGNGAPGIPNTGGVGGGNGEVLGEQTPGIPNTGAGGNAEELWTLLALSAMAAIGSTVVLLRGRLV